VTKQIVLSVKSGGVSVKDVPDLRGVLEREAAHIGMLICMQEPTQPMRAEAASAGLYETPGQEGKHYGRIQLLTIAELLEKGLVDYPPFRHELTFKPAPNSKGNKKHTHKPLEFGEIDHGPRL